MSPARTAILSTAAAAAFGLFLALPAGAVAPDPPSCTAEDRGITSFSCPGTPTEDVCGTAPNFTCYAGASEPCDFVHYTFNCASCSCQCKSAQYPCAGCTDPTSDPAGTVSCAGNPACPTGGVYSDRCSQTPACPGTQVRCGTPSPGSCVVDNSAKCLAFPGTTWDPCTDECTSPYIIRNSSPTQSNASIDIDGDITAGGDLYLNSGQAIHIDDSGLSWFQVGNWTLPDQFSSLNLNLLGSALVRDRLGVGYGFQDETDVPEYPIDVKSSENSAIANLADMGGGLWTGLRLARGADTDAERWFIGMSDGEDTLRLNAKVFDGEGYSDKSVNISDGGFYSGLQVTGEYTNPTYHGFFVAQSLSPLSCSPLGGCSPTDGWPWGVDGTIYYNAQLGKLRCYEDGEWKNCVTDGGLGGAGAGDTGQVAIWQSGSDLYGNPLLFWDDADKLLGVGTGTPEAHLDVVSDGEYLLNTVSFTQTGALDWYGDPFTSNVLRVYRDLDASSTGPNGGALLSIEDSGSGGSTGPLIEARVAGQTRFSIDGGTDTSVLRLNDTSGSRIWTGQVLSRGGAEKWFIGMNASNDSLRLRQGSATDAVSVEAANNASYRLNLLSPGGATIYAGADPTAIMLRSDNFGTWDNAIDVYSTTGTAASVGTNRTYFMRQVGIFIADPTAALDVRGTGIVTTAFKMPTTPAPTAGYVLTTDVNGVGTWQPGIGSVDECSGGKYAQMTASNYDGGTDANGINGYSGGNAKCAALGTGYHMCTAEEILRTMNCGSTAPADGTIGWISSGPPGFTIPAANDCAGWTTDAGTSYGAYWQISAATGGKGFATGCDRLMPIYCCKKK